MIKYAPLGISVEQTAMRAYSAILANVLVLASVVRPVSANATDDHANLERSRRSFLRQQPGPFGYSRPQTFSEYWLGGMNRRRGYGLSSSYQLLWNPLKVEWHPASMTEDALALTKWSRPAVETLPAQLFIGEAQNCDALI